MKTPNLELVEIDEADSPAYQEVNDAFRALDSVVQLTVISITLATPPDAPRQGDRYIVPLGATGEWAGKINKVAYRTVDGWTFRTPRPGWIAFVQDEDTQYCYRDTGWDLLLSGSSPAALPNFSGGHAAETLFELDYLLGGAHELTLQGNVHLSVANATAGKVTRTHLILRQDSAGGWTVQWPAGTFWEHGAPPPFNTQPRAVHIIELSTYDGGVTIYARLLAGTLFAGDVVPATYPTSEDAYWPYVSHLMHMEGTNGGTVFTDEKGHTVTRVGTPTTTTAHRAFGVASASFNGPLSGLDYFSGDNINYLRIAEGPDNDFTSGDFCLEGFVKLKSLGSVFNGWVFAIKGDETTTDHLFFGLIFNSILIGGYGDQLLAYNPPGGSGGSGRLNTTDFRHVAYERKNGVIYLCLDGYLWTDGIVRDFIGDFDYTTGDFQIGGGQISGFPGGANYRFCDAYIDELRLTLGGARYAPSAPPPNVDKFHFFSRYTPPTLEFEKPSAFTPQVKTRRRVVGAHFSGGGAAVEVGVADVHVRMPYAGRIVGVTMLAQGGPGTAAVDVWVSDYATFPPSAGDSITAGNLPTITSASAYADEVLTGWDIEFGTGDVVSFHLQSNDVLEDISLQLDVEERL